MTESGTAAGALVGDVDVVLGVDANDDPAQSWLDIHSLLHVHGTWKIMNKTAMHATRADGLGAARVANRR